MTGSAGCAETLSVMFLVNEFTEEFTMGSSNTLNAGSIPNGCRQNVFHPTQLNESPIRDAGMAAEISRIIKSQILYQANKAVHAQAGALNPSALSLVRDFG